jgi:response regulator RpfG family c-di-GMP phosphodiesterase
MGVMLRTVKMDICFTNLRNSEMTNQNKPREIRKRTILIVDDDKSVVLGLGRQLKKHINVLPARSAEEALHVLQTQSNIDVVATDLQMPGKDGLQLLTFLKENHPKVKRILFTGHVNDEKVREARDDIGLTALMFKPLDPRDLLDHARGTYELTVE